ncbi:MAG: PfkB family carbohydrate kinase [Pyrobaculum sp.]
MQIVVAGNPTIDIIYTSGGVLRRYGGPIYYAATAISALYKNVKVVGVASRDDVGQLSAFFNSIGVDAELIEADRTTTFELDYRVKPRRVRLVERPARKITYVRGDVVILSPVYDELAGAAVEAKTVVADLQGYIRAGAEPPRADLVHFSIDDVALDLAQLREFAKRWPAAVYTLGEDGAYVVREGRIYYINSARIAVEEATGSGDVFLALLTYFHYIQGKDLLEAVCEASKYVAGYLLHRKAVRRDFDCVIQAVQERQFY